MSPRYLPQLCRTLPWTKFAAPLYNQVRQELFVAEETTQNSVEISTEALCIRALTFHLVAAPAPADDALCQPRRSKLATSIVTTVKSELATECTEDPSHWTAGEWISTSRFRLDAKHLCVDVGHHDIVDGVRDGNRRPRAV